MIKTTVRRLQETKSIGLVIENGVQHNAAITNPDIAIVLPGMAQGNTNSTRIGDKVSPVSLKRSVVRLASTTRDLDLLTFPSRSKLCVSRQRASGIATLWLRMPTCRI